MKSHGPRPRPAPLANGGKARLTIAASEGYRLSPAAKIALANAKAVQPVPQAR